MAAKTKKIVNRFQNKLDKLLKSGVLKKGYQPKYEHIHKKHWKLDEINFIADNMLEWFRAAKNIWFKDFAISLDLPYKTLNEVFRKKSEYFENIYQHCKDIQESKLFHLGIKTRSSMPIFALKNVSKWRDKQEHEHIIRDVKEIKKEIEEVFEQ